MRPIAELDLECYPTYFLAKFMNPDCETFTGFGMWEGQPLDIQGIVNYLAGVTIVTFNGNNYDLQMLTLALYGATNAQLKEANDDIIVRKLPPWTFAEKWGIAIPEYIDHIDVMEVAPGVKIGLKMYMGRLHAPRMQDLPYDPDSALDAQGRYVIDTYCGNDLVGTRMLRKEVWRRIELRMAIGERYGVDVRSKSDAQVAEAVFKAQLDFKPYKRYIQHGYNFKYTPPDYIRFVTPEMRELLETVRRADFTVTDKEEAYMLYGDATGIRTGVNIPAELKNRDIIIGRSSYRMGIGGLHSQESCVSHYTLPGIRKLRDIDVKSYYPSLILTMGMVPEQLGPAFAIIYRAIYDRRLLSKSESQRIAKLWKDIGAPELIAEAEQLLTESDGLKIVLNGVFGKLFSKYSIFYAPELGIRTTITGQLALLMLIEMMECSGIAVISANTDGIVLSIPAGMENTADNIVAWWELETGLEMESKDYRSLHQRDVNNYIAITMDGEVKRNGVYRQGGVLSGPQGKGPNMDICADAAVAYLKSGTPIEETVRACTDVRKFITIRTVTGGGSFVMPLKMGANGVDFLGAKDEYLGKAVRWYYSTQGGHIEDKQHRRVAGSSGCMPAMELPQTLPTDINYDKYIAEAMELLADAGLRVQYFWHDHVQQAKIEHYRDFNPLHPTVFGWKEIDRKTYEKRKAS